MAREFTQADADAHNALTAEAWRLIEGQLLLNEPNPVGSPGWLARRRLRRAVSLFERALAINPDGWQSMWAVGKIHQRLGDPRQALRWFGRAFDLNPAQPDVAREAGLAALDTGDGDHAVQYCEAAVRNAPDDPGLLANLALAHVLRGDDAAGRRCADEAVRRAPDDAISKGVRAWVGEVAGGTRRRPRSMTEWSRYW